MPAGGGGAETRSEREEIPGEASVFVSKLLLAAGSDEFRLRTGLIQQKKGGIFQ